MTSGNCFPNICTLPGSHLPTQSIAIKTLHITYQKLQLDAINALASVESNACYPGQVQYLKTCSKTYRTYTATNSLVIWGHCASEPHFVKLHSKNISVGNPILEYFLRQTQVVSHVRCNTKNMK